MKTKNDIITHLLVRCVIFTVFLLAFPQTALSQSPDGTFLHDEAGIAAYTYFPQGLDLSRVALSLRTVEATTGDYIIGIIDVPGFTPNYNVRVYAQSNGWMMAYYPPEALVSELFLWDSYYFEIVNILEWALHTAATADDKQVWNVDYFHFKYPNATWTLWVEEYAYSNFTIDVPFYKNGHYFLIYEPSWILGHTDRSGYTWSKYFFDGGLLASRYSYGWTYDILPRFYQGMVHSFELQSSGEGWGYPYSFLTLTYREPDRLQDTIIVRDAEFVTHTPLRYPVALINDVTPPNVLEFTYEVIHETWSICRVNWAVDELSYYIFEESWYTDGITHTMTYRYPQVMYYEGFHFRVSCHEPGVIYSYQITVTDMSGNVGYSPRYRYQMTTNNTIYLPLVIRHTP